MTDNEVYKVYRATPGHKGRRVHKVRRGLWEDRLAHRGFKAMLVLLVHKDLWDHKVLLVILMIYLLEKELKMPLKLYKIDYIQNYFIPPQVKLV